MRSSLAIVEKTKILLYNPKIFFKNAYIGYAFKKFRRAVL